MMISFCSSLSKTITLTALVTVTKVVEAAPQAATLLEFEATTLTVELEAALDTLEVEFDAVEVEVDAEAPPRAEASCLVPSTATAVKFEKPWAIMT